MNNKKKVIQTFARKPIIPKPLEILTKPGEYILPRENHFQSFSCEDQEHLKTNLVYICDQLGEENLSQSSIEELMMLFEKFAWGGGKKIKHEESLLPTEERKDSAKLIGSRAAAGGITMDKPICLCKHQTGI